MTGAVRRPIDRSYCAWLRLQDSSLGRSYPAREMGRRGALVVIVIGLAVVGLGIYLRPIVPGLFVLIRAR